MPTAGLIDGWVTDDAGFLSTSARDELNDRLRAFEASTGHQFIVYITPSSRGEPMASFTMRLFNKWGIGRRIANDGVVLWILPDNGTQAKRWITTGYGVMEALTDPDCARICVNIIKPKMEAGDHDGAVRAGVDAIIGELAGMSVLPVERHLHD